MIKKEPDIKPGSKYMSLNLLINDALLYLFPLHV